MKNHMKRILALVLAMITLTSICCVGALAYAGQGTAGSSAGKTRIKVVTNGWPINYVQFCATKQGYCGSDFLSVGTWMNYGITISTISGKAPFEKNLTWWNEFGRSDFKVWLRPNSTYYITLTPLLQTLRYRHAFWKISGSSRVSQAYIN